jgi:hypothetical protein
MRRKAEIGNLRMRQEENVRKKEDKKNSIQFWFKESKRRNKKRNHFNYKGEFKASIILKDLKKKTKPIKGSPFKGQTKKN